MNEGFQILKKGTGICLVATGYMTRVAMEVSAKLSSCGMDIGVADVFTLKNFNRRKLLLALKNYRMLVTLEEGFIGNGGLDCLVSGLLSDMKSDIKMEKIGFKDGYVFENGGREYLHCLNKMDAGSVRIIVEKLWKQ